MADPVEIARLIQDLAGSEERQRVQAGMKLYLAGVNLVMPLLSQWVRDPEFCELTLPDRLADSSIAGAESGSKVSSAHAKYSSSTIVVGLAVHPETFEKIRAANNSPVLAEVPPDQDAREFELHFDDSIELDILTSKEAAAAGAIARFLQKFGEGIQQIEVYVRNVDRATEILRGRFGLAPVYPARRAGANGTRINFFLAATPDGKKVLIELVETEG
ncbi:MAG: hypothetical protein WB630_25280 [Candidatus Acidiferrales bacterium]